MYRLRTFRVVPALPEALTRLRELAYNFWWSWNGDASDLFGRLDPGLWDEVRCNPVQVLDHISQDRLDEAAADPAYLAELRRVLTAFDAYMSREAWFQKAHAEFGDGPIVYFSMEFGIHECLPTYAGGLGILAGDHLKSSSDLGLPLIGVGLLYRQGYFQQRLTTDGWQLEEYPSLDFYQIPASRVEEEGGRPVTIQLRIGPNEVRVQVWRVRVGRVSLYLLDTDIPENAPEDREITHRLYGGRPEMRLRQEILLGIGGLRALDAMGIHPHVCHMNEGHAAFLAVARIRQRMEENDLEFGEAREAVASSLVFTTHTPNPAGIDRFEAAQMATYLSPYLPGIGHSLEEFTALGKMDSGDPEELFSMAVMALRLAGFVNGVSAMHGHVSREIWHRVWPGAPRDEVPITSITNGVHTGTWISPEMSNLLDRYLGPQRATSPEDAQVWSRVDGIPDIELWRVHERRRVALVAFARRRVKAQLRRRGAPPVEVKAADEFLDPEALTIGFARRFAPYKRGALVFRDPDRLLRIIKHSDRPVQFIFAGKAHPRDDNGKEVIKKIMAFVHRPEFRRRVVFIENYDMAVARYMVQGVDVWLNNPIKPHEASGTSGMKAAPNGGLNLSILDGWWPEAFDGQNGWAIDEGQIHEDAEYRDHIQGEALYELLEKEIVPTFYDRGSDGLPRAWIARMKASIRSISPIFDSTRMLKEYATLMYVPAGARGRDLSRDDFTAARALSNWKREMNQRWDRVKIEDVQAGEVTELPVGTRVDVRARVQLGGIKPQEVAVELYHGRIDATGQLIEGQDAAMRCVEHVGNGAHWFEGQIPCLRSGQHGYAVRVLPNHADLAHRFDTGLIRWG